MTKYGKHDNKKFECEWCGWEGGWDDLEPLGSMTENTYEDVIGVSWEEDYSMSECPECGEPSPLLKG